METEPHTLGILSISLVGILKELPFDLNNLKLFYSWTSNVQTLQFSNTIVRLNSTFYAQISISSHIVCLF